MSTIAILLKVGAITPRAGTSAARLGGRITLHGSTIRIPTSAAAHRPVRDRITTGNTARALAGRCNPFRRAWCADTLSIRTGAGRTLRPSNSRRGTGALHRVAATVCTGGAGCCFGGAAGTAIRIGAAITLGSARSGTPSSGCPSVHSTQLHSPSAQYVKSSFSEQSEGDESFWLMSEPGFSGLPDFQDYPIKDF